VFNPSPTFPKEGMIMEKPKGFDKEWIELGKKIGEIVPVKWVYNDQIKIWEAEDMLTLFDSEAAWRDTVEGDRGTLGGPTGYMGIDDKIIAELNSGKLVIMYDRWGKYGIGQLCEVDKLIVDFSRKFEGAVVLVVEYADLERWSIGYDVYSTEGEPYPTEATHLGDMKWWK